MSRTGKKIKNDDKHMNNEKLTLNIKNLALLKLNPVEYYNQLNDEDEKSYFHKPHLGALPHDLHTNDPEKLKERLDACKEELKKAEQELKELQEFKSNVESVEQYNEEVIENAEKQLGYIRGTWESVQDLAEEYDDPYDEDSHIYDWYTAMEDFMDEMDKNPGFITGEIKDKYEALYGIEESWPEDYADDESGYPSWGPLHGFETYLEDREQLERQATNYLNDFNIDGNGKYAKELKSRLDKLPDDWEEKNRTINREIGKAETKVNDFKEHQKKIEEKLGENEK